MSKGPSAAASTKTGLFLMELIIMLLFFALCAAICMRMFGAAQVSSDHSRDLSYASLKAQSAAECYKAAEGDLAETARLMAGADLGDAPVPEEGRLVFYYGGDWEPVADSADSAGAAGSGSAEAEAVWRLTLTDVGEGRGAIVVGPVAPEAEAGLAEAEEAAPEEAEAGASLDENAEERETLFAIEVKAVYYGK